MGSVAQWCGRPLLPTLSLYAFLFCNKYAWVHYPWTYHFIARNTSLSCLMSCQSLIFTSCELFEQTHRNYGLFFENIVPMQNLQFSRLSLCDKKSVLYLQVSGFRDDIKLSWVVDGRVRFDLSSPITHLLSNRSALITWCCLSV